MLAEFEFFLLFFCQTFGRRSCGYSHIAVCKFVFVGVVEYSNNIRQVIFDHL